MRDKISLIEEYRGSLSTKGMKEHFRRYSLQGKSKLEAAVQRLREKVHYSRYEATLKALVTAAPATYAPLFKTNVKLGELAHFVEPFAPIPFESELRWTALWLGLCAKNINHFRKLALEVSELVGAEKYELALERLEQFTRQSGHSFWAVELKIALTQLSAGNEAAKEFVTKLREECPSNSVPGFLSYLFGERNDELLSYDAFYVRCKENIPRMNIDIWLKDYLLYRSLQHYELSPDALGQNLRNERLSSLIDLYETFVETCMTVCSSHELRRHRSDVLAALDLIGEVNDFRLKKIRLYAGGNWPEDLECAGDNASTWSDLHPFILYKGAVRASLAASERRKGLINDLYEVWNKGSGADKPVARLLKFGVNLKSLDLGVAIASHAERQSSKTGPLMLIASGAPLCLDGVSLEEVYGGPADLSKKMLEEYVTRSCAHQEGSAALSVIRGDGTGLDSLSELGKLWVANASLASGNYDIARQAADKLSSAGPRWVREARKHQFVSSYTRGDLRTACAVLTRSLVDDRALSVELPITEMLVGRKWRDFADIDPIQVGIAAHFAIDAPSGSPVGFFISQSCRAALKHGKRTLLDGSPEAEPNDAEREQLVLFFSEVWNEDTLARSGSFETTHDVRTERLHVIRRLLDWDPKHQNLYVDSIKTLTLDETLWLGVRQINETRVFVNEPAITRWAEKEIYDDYRRWLESSKVDSTPKEVTESKILDFLSAAIDKVNGVTSLSFVTENDFHFVTIVSRLLRHFLNDPTDGLNCYLSVRVRHGSLLRALFDPSESIDLLQPENEGDAVAEQRVASLTGVHWADVSRTREALQKFSSGLRAVGDDLVRNRIQLEGEDHPKGLIKPAMQFALVFERLTGLAKLGDFSFLLESCYANFWQALSGSLEDARRYMSIDIKSAVEELFSVLIQELESIGTVSNSFVGSVKQAATHTGAACDVTAKWFQLPNRRDVLTFDVGQAVEIARRIVQALNSAFQPRVTLDGAFADIPFSGVGLSTVADCLFVIFDNVWEHSGAGDQPEVKLNFTLEDDVLWLDAEGLLDADVYETLKGGQLAEILNRLEEPGQDALASKEGGSGLAKMKRLTRSVVSTAERPAFQFGVGNASPSWFVKLGMRLHKSENGAYYVH